MEDRLKDKIIRDRLTKDEVLPEIINLKVNEALLNIQNGFIDEIVVNKEKNNKKSRFIKVAAIIFFILGGTAIVGNYTTISTYAKEIIGSVFKVMNDENNFNKYNNINENFEKYSNKEVAKSSDKGVTVKVTNVFTDGFTMKLGYIIEGENISEKISQVIGWSSSCDDKFYSDDEEVQVVGDEHNYKIIDANTYIVIRTIKANKKLKEKFNLKWKMPNIQREIEGEWNFEVQVDSTVLCNESKKIQVNKDYKIGEVEYHLKNIIYFPTELYIDLKAIASIDYNIYDEDGNSKVLIVTDENGVIIQGNSGLSACNDKTKIEIEYKFYGFVKEIPKEFNIIPVVIKEFDNKTYDVGQKIDISNREKINVNVE